MAGVFAANLEGGERPARERALALAGTAVGGMVLARAVERGGSADALRLRARAEVLNATGWAEG